MLELQIGYGAMTGRMLPIRRARHRIGRKIEDLDVRTSAVVDPRALAETPRIDDPWREYE
jgi:hypothetical protein